MWQSQLTVKVRSLVKKMDWAVRNMERSLNVPFWPLSSYFLMSRRRFKKKRVRVLFIGEGKARQTKKDEGQSVFFSGKCCGRQEMREEKTM